MYPIAVHIYPFQCTELQIEQAFANGSFFMTIEFTVKTSPYLPYSCRHGRPLKREAFQTVLYEAPSCLVLVALNQMVHRLV